MEKNYFKSLIGYKAIKQEIYRIIDQLNNPEKYKKFGIKEPHGLLLHGVPGVGKTTLANCVLEASGRKVFVCRKDAGNSYFPLEISNIFEEAERLAPSIILLEDMDKYANEDRFRKDAEEYVTIQACIDKVKDKQVFVVATVNDIKKLPESLIRAGRFDHVIEMKCPTGKDAEEIILHYLKQKSFVGELDIKLIANLLEGRSCAELETVVNQAATYAAFEDSSQVEMKHMIKAILRIVLNAPESFEQNEKVLPLVACHEAGHALVAELLEPGSVNLVTTLNHESSINGLISVRRDESYGCSKELMEYRVMHLLAGKAATEICYGTTDMGAKADLSRAYSIVYQFTDVHCSEGFDKFIHGGHPSNELLNRRDGYVAKEMDKYYEKTKQLILDNRNKLDALISRLIEEKTLLGNQVQEIIKSTKEEEKVFLKYKNLEELAKALGLPKGPDKRCVLKQFMQSFDFVKQTKEFKMADIQRYLKCGYGTACKVVDALCDLWVIEKKETSPISFIRIENNL